MCHLSGSCLLLLIYPLYNASIYNDSFHFISNFHYPIQPPHYQHTTAILGLYLGPEDSEAGVENLCASTGCFTTALLVTDIGS